MSRYIEIAHRSESSGAVLADAGILLTPVVRVAPARRIFAVKPLRYNDLTRRRANIVGAIARHENDLAQAQKSPLAGGSSRGFQLQILRRLHQARGELAALPVAV